MAQRESHVAVRMDHIELEENDEWQHSDRPWYWRPQPEAYNTYNMQDEHEPPARHNLGFILNSQRAPSYSPPPEQRVWTSTTATNTQYEWSMYQSSMQSFRNETAAPSLPPPERNHKRSRKATHATSSAMPLTGRAAPPVPPEPSVSYTPQPRQRVLSTDKKPLDDKKRGRTCKTEGCDNYIVYKGLCCRHGGDKKCSVEGCETSAKHKGLCWKHGGSVECKMVGCTKKAKAKGLCWAHGGGTKCMENGCEKVAISNGSCWAHGGGKRCIYDGCNKPAYGRTNDFCTKHFAELQDVNYYEV